MAGFGVARMAGPPDEHGASFCVRRREANVHTSRLNGNFLRVRYRHACVGACTKALQRAGVQLEVSHGLCQWVMHRRLRVLCRWIVGWVHVAVCA